MSVEVPDRPRPVHESFDQRLPFEFESPKTLAHSHEHEDISSQGEHHIDFQRPLRSSIAPLFVTNLNQIDDEKEDFHEPKGGLRKRKTYLKQILNKLLEDGGRASTARAKQEKRTNEKGGQAQLPGGDQEPPPSDGSPAPSGERDAGGNLQDVAIGSICIDGRPNKKASDRLISILSRDKAATQVAPCEDGASVFELE